MFTISTYSCCLLTSWAWS